MLNVIKSFQFKRNTNFKFIDKFIINNRFGRETNNTEVYKHGAEKRCRSVKDPKISIKRVSRWNVEFRVNGRHNFFLFYYVTYANGTFHKRTFRNRAAFKSAVLSMSARCERDQTLKNYLEW